MPPDCEHLRASSLQARGLWGRGAGLSEFEYYLDMAWTAQNYHDLHDKFMAPTSDSGTAKRSAASISTVTFL